jgi:hypothetical protein
MGISNALAQHSQSRDEEHEVLTLWTVQPIVSNDRVLGTLQKASVSEVCFDVEQTGKNATSLHEAELSLVTKRLALRIAQR